MFRPVRVVDVEVSRPITDVVGPDSYGALKALVRLHGMPVGYVTLPLEGGRCTAHALTRAIAAQHGSTIMRHLLRNRLTAPLDPEGVRVEDLVAMSPPDYGGAPPLVTAAVCTRDRPTNLKLCLDALSRLDYPQLDLMVVDNAPADDRAEHLVRSSYPHVRYVREPRPGLNWARNRVIKEARGEIVAYTDDDVVVDRGWIAALAAVFVENPEVMAVTGLVVPYELETESQMLFEDRGGFARGFDRRWYRLNRDEGRTETYHIDASRFGTGANMAFRRSIFDWIGAFDPALDVGTVTNGGGDLDMFFRVLQEGHTLVYEPAAVVRHRHRRDHDALRAQMTDNGIGFSAYLVRNALAYPSQRAAIIRFALRSAWRQNLGRLLTTLVVPARFPRDLIAAELLGTLIGLVRYHRARRIAAGISRTFDGITPAATLANGRDPAPRRPASSSQVA
jgi:GT2 family glycosyltransferase